MPASSADGFSWLQCPQLLLTACSVGARSRVLAQRCEREWCGAGGILCIFTGASGKVCGAHCSGQAIHTQAHRRLEWFPLELDTDQVRLHAWALGWAQSGCRAAARAAKMERPFVCISC